MGLFTEPLQKAQKELALLQKDNTLIRYTTGINNTTHNIFTYTPCKIVNDLKESIVVRGTNISYNGWGDYDWFHLFENIRPMCYGCFEMGFDMGYKPLLCIYTPTGKYGYSKLDFYYAQDDWCINVVYEYKWKDHVRKEYYSAYNKQ